MPLPDFISQLWTKMGCEIKSGCGLGMRLITGGIIAKSANRIAQPKFRAEVQKCTPFTRPPFLVVVRGLGTRLHVYMNMV